MPRYFFHIRTNAHLMTDPDGDDLETVEQAVEEARKSARELLAAKVRADLLVDGDTFVITSEDGVVVREVPLKSVLRLA